MIAREEIHQMPLHEKLLIMEAIWEDLSSREDQVDVPQWHRELLDAREKLIVEGKARFTDWEDAKKEIRKKIR